MKKLFLIAGLFYGLFCSAQEVYFTVYNFSVEPQNVTTIYTLFDEYFSENKPTNVSVALYENHFNDSSNNYTHSVVFSGNLDDMGNMYSGDNNDTWNLFITRVNQHMKDGFSSAMGTRISHSGDLSKTYPIQRYFLLNVDDTSKWIDSFNNTIGKNFPAGALIMMGNITAGRGPDGVNIWVITAFKDFKTAMAGAGILRSEAEKEANSKAWEEHRANGGESNVVRTGLRIQLKSW